MSQANFASYMECSLDLAVDLVNTHDPRTGLNDGIPNVEALGRFLDAHKIPGRPAAADLQPIWDLAVVLREVFDSEDERRASRILNDVLADSGARPELTDHDRGSWHLHFAAPGSSLARRIGAEAAMALSVVIAEDGFERLRECDADDCYDAFVDQSRNRSRRYCSPAVCGNRAAVAAFRARRRAATHAD